MANEAQTMGTNAKAKSMNETAETLEAVGATGATVTKLGCFCIITANF